MRVIHVGMRIWVSHNGWGTLKMIWNLSVKRGWIILLLVSLKMLILM